ncbi:MAG TPA: protein phosphatase 2C domain-containing protein [Thermoanaerobaculia bacterium]|nr:protein phosphatase 2C domain-containing protein [Thermoanaerobaculia bacterium]
MPVSSARRLAAAAGSDPGLERENNEDRVLCDPERGIFAVIDGVGGEEGGEIAAQTALDVLRARLSRRTTDPGRLVREAIALANKQIFEQSQRDERLAGMACVLTVAVLDGGKLTVGHVGDSRLYALRPGEIRKVTRDHSPVGAREDAGEISELEAMHHPRRNEIFRDVGSAPHEPDDEGFIDVQEIPFEPDGAILICSDGLSDLVTAGAILDTVESRAKDPEDAVDELIAQANAQGGKDNISVVLVLGERFAQGAGRRPAATDTRRTSAAGPAPGSRGRGASVKPTLGERLRSPWAILLYLLILAGVGYLYREPLLDLARDRGLFPPRPEDVILVVGTGPGELPTIAAALAQAQPKQTIEVTPGIYREAVVLKSGVSLLSRAPLGAVLREPTGSGPAVTAQGVRGARLSGFRIEGDGRTPLAVGLRLIDSEVDVRNLDISGATVAGVEIAGRDRSSIQYSSIHDNPGGGVFVADEAVPVLLQNLITKNGTLPKAPRPGIEVRDKAKPELKQNQIEENGGPGILLASEANAEEYFRWNTFGKLTREQAIRTAAPPAPPTAAPTAPTTPPRRSGEGR